MAASAAGQASAHTPRSDSGAARRRATGRQSSTSRGRSLVPGTANRAAAERVAEEAGVTEEQRVEVLAEALPYLQRFAGKTFVVKYGGAAMTDEGLKEGVMRDIALLAAVGIKPVLVHGGGPEITTWLERTGIEAQFVDGRRVTDEATMEVVEMVLCGKVNKDLVSLLNHRGCSAVGLSGKDGELLSACQEASGKLGRVGEIRGVSEQILLTLLANNHVPVVATVGADEAGGALNINADDAAGAIASKLQAEKLLLMTDVPGILTRKDDPSSLLPEASLGQVQSMLSQGHIEGGMVPKASCCASSVRDGVRAAHIVDGRLPNSLLLEVFTDLGRGTMIHDGDGVL